MNDAEMLKELERSHERRRKFKRYLDKAMVDPENKFDFAAHPFPWTAAMVIWDGPGVQFFDAGGSPVLSDLLRDQDDAVTLLDLCNTLGSRAAGQASLTCHQELNE